MKTGDKVKIIKGSMKGFTGVILEIKLHYADVTDWTTVTINELQINWFLPLSYCERILL